MKSKKARIWQNQLARINEKPAPLTPEEKRTINNVDAKVRQDDRFGLTERAIKGIDGVWRQGVEE